MGWVGGWVGVFPRAGAGAVGWGAFESFKCMNLIKGSSSEYNTVSCFWTCWAKEKSRKLKCTIKLLAEMVYKGKVIGRGGIALFYDEKGYIWHACNAG